MVAEDDWVLASLEMVEFGVSGVAVDMMTTTSVPAEGLEEEQKLASGTSLATAVRPAHAPTRLEWAEEAEKSGKAKGCRQAPLTFSLGSTCSRWKILEGLYQSIFF